MPVTTSISAILVDGIGTPKDDLRAWGLEVEADVSGRPTLTGLDLTANNPDVVFSDSDSSNAARIILDNTGWRFELDDAMSVPSSIFKFSIDDTVCATLGAGGDFAVTGEIEGASLGTALRAVINAGTGVYRSGYTQCPANGASATFVHGLGAVPDLVQVDLVCHTAHSGFAVDDRYPLSATWAYGNHGFGIVLSATDVVVRVPTNGIIVVGSSNAEVNVTAANFNLQVKAARFDGI